MLRPLICDRARAQVSLELDGELSQLEGAMLRAHLRRCAECRSFAGALEPIVGEIRAAPLEEPSRPVSVVRWRAARFRSARRVAAQVGIAATFLVGVLGAATNVGRSDELDQRAARPAGALFRTLWSPEVEQAQLAASAPQRWRVGERHGGLFTV